MKNTGKCAYCQKTGRSDKSGNCTGCGAPMENLEKESKTTSYGVDIDELPATRIKREIDFTKYSKLLPEKYTIRMKSESKERFIEILSNEEFIRWCVEKGYCGFAKNKGGSLSTEITFNNHGFFGKGFQMCINVEKYKYGVYLSSYVIKNRKPYKVFQEIRLISGEDFLNKNMATTISMLCEFYKTCTFSKEDFEDLTIFPLYEAYEEEKALSATSEILFVD